MRKAMTAVLFCFLAVVFFGGVLIEKSSFSAPAQKVDRSRSARADNSCTMGLAQMKSILEDKLGQWKSRSFSLKSQTMGGRLRRMKGGTTSRKGVSPSFRPARASSLPKTTGPLPEVH